VYREVAIVFVAAGPTRGPSSDLSYRAVKVARGVLRWGSGGNATSLPDPPAVTFSKVGCLCMQK
jgi:hypothetical protein